MTHTLFMCWMINLYRGINHTCHVFKNHVKSKSSSTAFKKQQYRPLKGYPFFIPKHRNSISHCYCLPSACPVSPPPRLDAVMQQVINNADTETITISGRRQHGAPCKCRWPSSKPQEAQGNEFLTFLAQASLNVTSRIRGYLTMPPLPLAALLSNGHSTACIVPSLCCAPDLWNKESWHLWGKFNSDSRKVEAVPWTPCACFIFLHTPITT